MIPLNMDMGTTDTKGFLRRDHQFGLRHGLPGTSAFPKAISILGCVLFSLLGSFNSVAHANPVLDKASLLLREGRAEAASAIYSEYLQRNPQSLQAQLALAEIAMRRYNYPTAQRLLEKALVQHPDSPEPAAMLGKLFQAWSNAPSGKTADNSRDYLALANEHFSQARAIGPANPMALSAVAEWDLQQNDLVSAERNLQQALRITPTYVPAFQGLVRFYIKVKDLSRARDAAMHALELDPNNSISYFLTAQLLGLNNHPAEAVKYAVKSESLDYGRLPERDYFLASQYEKLGELPLAVRYYETLTAYTPKEAQVWMKLGDLYERQNNASASMTAYQKAIALKPEILTDLLNQARESTRSEKIQVALSQWRRVLTLQPQAPDIVDEAWSQIANLYAIHHFLTPDQPLAEQGRDLAALQTMLSQQPNQPTRQLDRLKIAMANQPEQSEAHRQTLISLMEKADPAIAGEAAFLLGQYDKTTELLESVDGLSADEYARLADRLLANQELMFSQVFYQRAYEQSHDPSLTVALKRIAAKQALADQKIDTGNLFFNRKKYTEALPHYQDAVRIYPQWNTGYLRLGDTYERLRKWPQAKQAYDTAVLLSPSLLDSQGFAKSYKRLQKKVASK